MLGAWSTTRSSDGLNALAPMFAKAPTKNKDNNRNVLAEQANPCSTEIDGDRKRELGFYGTWTCAQDAVDNLGHNDVLERQ